MIKLILDRFPDETFIAADGFDDAILGVDEVSMRLIYSVQECVDILREQMPAIEAKSYFFMYIVGAYHGENSPIWCFDDFTSSEIHF